MAKMSSSMFEEENQRLLTDYFASETPSPNVARFKYSNTTSELSSLCYQSIMALPKRYSSCSNLPTTSTCFVNGVLQTNDETFTTPPQDVSKLENILIPLDMSFWHPSYLIPPKVDHPLQKNLLNYIGKSCSRYILGFIIGLVFFAIFCFLFILVVPIKTLYFLFTRCSYRGLYGWLFVKNHCDPMWPWGQCETKTEPDIDPKKHLSRDNSLLVITLQGSLETDQLMQIIWRKLLRHMKRFSDDTSVEDQMREHVKLLWSRDENLHLHTLDDLESFLRNLYLEPMDIDKIPWKVYVVTDFGDTECTLVILKQSTPTSDHHSCPLKMTCVMNDSKLFFISSPHVLKEAFISHICVNFFISLWHFFRVLSIGPIEVLSSLARAPTQVWTHAKRLATENGSKVKPESTENFQLTWARLPNTDMLAHAEKVLRVSTQEILTSFVAGALRRHFKANGVKHPPSLLIDVPLALDERQYTVQLDQPCNFTLMPVSLATDIDGAVPRAWETQRRMCKAIESSFWRTCESATLLNDLLFPESWVRKLLSSTHSSCDGFVCFWRTISELSISNQKIYSILIYPSLAKTGLINASDNRGKFGFTFVQTGRDIMLSLLVDSKHFSDVNNLLNNFQTEFHHLLNHLSSKMTTLTHISIMPQPSPNSPVNYIDELESQIDTALIITQEEPVEELEILLVTVQNELEDMKNSPIMDGRQTDYLLKLAQLEEKMEAFHGEIVEKLNSANPSKIPYEKQLGETTWYDILKMYSNSSSHRNDLFVKRKRSKRMSTPSVIVPKHNRLPVVSEWP